MKTNLPEKTSQNGIEYILHGDYYLPDIALSESDPKRRTSMITRFQGIKHNLIEENRAKKNGGMWRPVKIAPTQADEGHLQFPLKTFVE